jgi:heat shock protein 4
MKTNILEIIIVLVAVLVAFITFFYFKYKKQPLRKVSPLLQQKQLKVMSVVGIDFGNLNTIVAVARNRGIDVITNETSNRATPSLVSFSDKQRFLGEGAKTLETSNFKNTVGSLKRLSGRKFTDPEVKEYEEKYMNASLVKGENNQVAVSVSYKGDENTYTASQISAMFLGKVKQFTGQEIGIPVTDCVISCPTWFADAQRRALLDAAHVAGLNVLRLMNDTTASALGYGITKTDLPDLENGEKAKTVVFVDCGHTSTQVAVVSFSKGKLTVLGTACDRNLGGRDFDQAITDHYVKEFGAKYKMDVASNKKAVFRLRLGAEKVKKLLSAGASAPFNVECLMNDKDVSALVERVDFEEMTAFLIEKIQAPLDDALKNAGVSADDVDSVELIGGTTRIPKVKQAIAEFFGGSVDGPNKLQTTLNQDEAVARGCAFQCAILSPVFKVRDFSIQDINSHPIEITWDAAQLPDPKKGEKHVTQMDAFEARCAVPSGKKLTFSRLLRTKELGKAGVVNFKAHASYSESAVLPTGTSKDIGEFVIEGIKKYPSCDVKDGDKVLYSKATIQVNARLDGNGLITLDNAVQTEDEIVPLEEKKDDNGPDAAEVDQKAKTKKVTRKHPLTVTSVTAGASSDLLNTWLALEGEMAASDRLVIDTAEKRNELEEYVYETRSKLSEQWVDYMVETAREPFVAELNEMEDWLYGDGEDALKSVYSDKLEALKAIGEPVKVRYLQFEERPLAVKEFREYIRNANLDLEREVCNI